MSCENNQILSDCFLTEVEKETFFIIDDSYMNLTTAEWYRDKLATFTEPNEPKDIDIFRELLPDNMKIHTEKMKWRKCNRYRDLPIHILWKLFNDLYVLYSGLVHKTVKHGLTFDMIEKETQAIIQTLLYWSLKTDHPDKAFEHFDSSYVNGNCLNDRFRVHLRYMIDTMNETLEDMKSFFQLSTHSSGQNKEMEGKIMNLIRETSMGDLEEFLFYVKDEIETQTISKNHKILAKLKHYDYSGDSKILQKTVDQIKSEESFRVLFPAYFDENSSFEKFFHEHLYFCVLFFMKDYFEVDLQLSYLPIVNLYSDGTILSDNIFEFFDFNDLLASKK